MQTDVQTAYLRLNQWFQAHAPEYIRHPKQPNQTQDIAELANYFQRQLPEEYITWLMLDEPNPCIQSLFGDGTLETMQLLLQPSQIIQTRQNYQKKAAKSAHLLELFDTHQSIQHKLFDPHWLPFADDNRQATLWVDLNPGPTGTFGQLIYLSLEQTARFVYAESIPSCFKNLLSHLEQNGLILKKKERMNENNFDDIDFDEENFDDPRSQKEAEEKLSRFYRSHRR
ncbi:SMI1/KNR4 family protein [Algicola sagamiensis]|uniref:SMI1/KNR4 family protein n=1 Tax=Algicola sagamiensis TaxID=163869 RepID=UPI0003603F10|nr:SMI1/KNR4 family protein [Algicola sagamiensis]